MIERGGSFTFRNPGYPETTFSYSEDGTTISMQVAGAELVVFPVEFLKSILMMCGFIVMQRDQLSYGGGAS